MIVIIINNDSNIGQTTRPSDSQQKKRTDWIVDFAIQANHRVKLKESEKRDKYLRLCKRTEKTMGQEIDVDTNCN